MNRQERLAAEIEAQEKKIYRNPGQATPQAPAPRAKDDNEPDNSQASDTDVTIVRDDVQGPVDPQAVKDAQEPQKNEWEDRFKKFKPIADATIHGLRQENLALKEDIQSLKVQMRELAGKINEARTNKLDINGLFNDEERNLIGEETIKGIEKAVTSAIDANVNPLKSELEKEREERAKDEARKVEAERATSNAEFLTKLGEIAPNYRKFDRDPKFIQWMSGPDTVSGAPRERLFKTAQRVGDVHRVAEFFLEYERLIAPKKDEKMEKQLTPSNQGNAPATPNPNTKKRVLTMRQIDKFYDDVVAGKYRNRPKEQQKMEVLIDTALRNSGMGRKR